MVGTCCRIMTKMLLILLMLMMVQGRDSKSPFDLMSDYIQNHNPLQRPVSDPTSVLDVEVNFNLLHIEDLDETKQQLTTTAWFYFVWTVEGLMWDENKFQNISRVHVKPTEIFLPDLVVTNAVDKYGYLSAGELPLTVWSNGTVEWYAADLRTTSCKVDVTRFPFDHQKCSIYLHQWFTFASEVTYSFLDNPITFILYKENGEWEILDHSANVGYTYNGTYHELHFELLLGRRRAYYILTAVLPACVLSALNLLVFHVPSESGEKLTLCVSIFLSYAVYLTSINSLLPSVSDHVALFSVYLNCMFVLKALTVAASVSVLYFQSAKPNSYVRFVLTQRLLPKKKAIYLDVVKDGETSNSKDQEDAWIDIVKGADRILFYIFLSIFVICTMGFFAVCVL